MNTVAVALRQVAASGWLSRHLSTTVVATANAPATDPIQKLFIEKLREYGTKAKTAKDGLVEPTPQLQAEMNNELERIGRVYGFQPGEDTTKFPAFNFTEPTVDPINAKK